MLAQIVGLNASTNAKKEQRSSLRRHLLKNSINSRYSFRMRGWIRVIGMFHGDDEYCIVIFKRSCLSMKLSKAVAGLVEGDCEEPIAEAILAPFVDFEFAYFFHCSMERIRYDFLGVLQLKLRLLEANEPQHTNRIHVHKPTIGFRLFVLQSINYAVVISRVF